MRDLLDAKHILLEWRLPRYGYYVFNVSIKTLFFSFYLLFTALCCACVHFLWGSPIRGGRREGKKKKRIEEGRLLILEAKGNEGFA